MKHALLAAGILILVSACESSNERFDTQVEVPVSVEEVSTKPIEEFVVTTGTMNAAKDVTVNSETAGYYHLAVNPSTSRPFVLGDRVKKGRIIVSIENPEQLNNIKMESVKLTLDITKREFEKQQSLFEKGGVTLQELKNSERSSIDAQYNYDNALIQLAKLKITAPFAGVIVELPYYTAGVKISANDTMVRIMDYSTLTMEVNLPGNLMSSIMVGQSIRVKNYTIPDKVLEGTLTQMSPAIDPETRTFKTTVEIANPELVLRPGMFVKAEIVTASNDNTIVIPKDIIMSRRNQKTVFIVERGIAQERRIKIGLENPDEAEVVDGLKVDERMVVSGFETLRNGSKVKIQQ